MSGYHYHERTRAIVRELKEASPCRDCGVSYPYYVMDYDHRDPSEKIACVRTMSDHASLAKCLTEIAKCDLVCANCHRERTFVAMSSNGKTAASEAVNGGSNPPVVAII